MDKNSSVYKMVLLGVICAICGLILSGVNALTAPLIEQNSLAAVQSNLEEIYPGGTFSDVTDNYISLDDTGLIDGIYEAEGQGYIFTCNGIGYSSSGITFMVGFDLDGKISGYMALEQSETSGVGSRAFESEYTDTITSLTTSDEIPTLSGATLTSTAVKNGIEAAIAVFNQING